MKRTFLSLLGLLALSLSATASETEVSIRGDQFYINDRPTYEGRYWKGHKVEGLLMNARMVQGVFDDLNAETVDSFKYPDTGKWDADRNTREFVEAMQSWHDHGVLAFTLNLQGGSPLGYGNKGWINSAFDKNGEFLEAYQNRLKLILDEADRIGMVVILGYFYFGQDNILANEKAVYNAVDEVTEWLIEEDYTNVIVEVANECDIYYDHAAIQAPNVHKLIERVKSFTTDDDRRLLVSTSFSGNTVPTAEVVDVADFILIHGNGVEDPHQMTKLIEKTRAVATYTPMPIVVNEDDHYNYKHEYNNCRMAVESYASWGLFDFRREGDAFEEGFQSVPVDWSISTDRKKEFFGYVKEITAMGETPTTFENPILPGFHPDPSICRVGDDYYMVTSSFEWFPSIPIYHSKDMVNWELIGYGQTNPENYQIKDNVVSSGGIYAVTIRHHDGVFYLITTDIGGKGNFYCTATDPAGEWSAPVWLETPGIDPSLFWDEDGKCYYVGNGKIDGPQTWKNQAGAWVQEIDLKAQKMVGPRKQISYGHASNARYTEAPHIYKIDGKYMLILGEGGTEYYHAVSLFQSDDIWGPYIANHVNPIVSHRQFGLGYPVYAIGHADIVETQKGDWWLVALGKRKINGWTYLARETFLSPIRLEKDGQLKRNPETIDIIVNPGEGKMPVVAQRPDLPWTPVKATPIRDNFDGDKLDLQWNFLRTPMTQWYTLEEGEIELALRPETCSELKNPSLIAKRIKSNVFEASTRIDFSTRKANEEAGIVLYRNDTHYMSYTIKGKELVVKHRLQGKDTVKSFELPDDVEILSIKSDGTNVTCYYGETVGEMKRLDVSVSLQFLADEFADRFNGSMVGIYATSNGEKSKAKAEFEWFDLR